MNKKKHDQLHKTYINGTNNLLYYYRPADLCCTTTLLKIHTPVPMFIAWLQVSRATDYTLYIFTMPYLQQAAGWSVGWHFQHSNFRV